MHIYFNNYIIAAQKNPNQMQFQSQKNRSYMFLESNTEFLTVVRRTGASQTGKNLCLLTEYIKKNTQTKLDYQNFIQCFVQIAYLIYTAKYYGFHPQILKNFVKVEENVGYGGEKRFSVVIYYSLADTATDNKYVNIVIAIYSYLKQFYEEYEKKIKESQLETEQKAAIKNFFTQLSQIEARLSTFGDGQQQTYFYVLLEQTDLFRENSLLLKLKNCSILDYIKNKFMKFKLYKEQDQKQVKEYISGKSKAKVNINQLKEKQKQIQINIISFFQEIQKENPNKLKLKIQSDQNFRSKFIFTIYELPAQPFLARISKLLPSMSQTMQIQPILPPKQKLPYSQYQIQYHSERNVICVKLIMSTIVCSSESTDFTIYQANVITFQSANISLEFVEDKNEKMKKYLAFRGASCFNSKQPILQKILILMDLTMIAAKVCEPELISYRKSFIVDKDMHKLITINQKLNHYSKLFLKCAKKVYNQ